MAKASKAKSGPLSKPLYHSAKISEYQFKKVLWHFVLDDSAGETARHVDLSVNSISAIFTKLRVFFTELRIFKDIYEGGHPEAGTPMGEDFEGFEYRLIPFHLKRIDGKRATKATMLDEVDYYWNESFWRFHYSVLTDGRPSDAIHRMMYVHLLELIRLCGPVGTPAQNREEAEPVGQRHLAQRLLWLERNSANFADKNTREELRKLRER